MMDLQPRGPSQIASACVVGDAVDARPLVAEVIYALVDVDLTLVSFVSGQAIARVVDGRIETDGVVAALVVVAQATLELDLAQLTRHLQ